MENPLIVENPEGPIYIAVSEYNPVKPKTPSNSGVQVMVGDNLTQVSEDDLALMLVYDREGQIARGITMIDFFLNMLNFWFFLEPTFAVLALVSYVGYSGVLRYNALMVMIYLIYQYLLTIGKGVMIYMTIDQHANYKAISFVSIATFVQMCITYYIHKFYNKIRVLRSPEFNLLDV
jgi:hypothetical protein